MGGFSTWALIAIFIVGSFLGAFINRVIREAKESSKLRKKDPVLHDARRWWFGLPESEKKRILSIEKVQKKVDTKGLITGPEIKKIYLTMYTQLALEAFHRERENS